MPDLDDFSTLDQIDIEPKKGASPRNPSRSREKGASVKPLAYVSNSDTERFIPQAVVYRESNGRRTGTINIDGVIGELDSHGLDLFAGYIALSNGIGFRGLPCHQRCNPGGFGITFGPPNPSVPMVDMVVEKSSVGFAPWMAPFALIKENRAADISFPSMDEGANALLGYLDLIRLLRIPYFHLGPQTFLSDILLCFLSPCIVKTTYALSDIISYINRYDSTTIDQSNRSAVSPG